MAKLLDKLYNRLIEGKLKIESSDDFSEVNKPTPVTDESTYNDIGDSLLLEYTDGEEVFILRKGCGNSETNYYFSAVGGDDGLENATIMFAVVNRVNPNSVIEFYSFSPNEMEVMTHQLINSPVDAGKFLQVQNDGTVAPASVSGGGGTQLYKHVITFEDGADNKNRIVTLILPFSTPIVKYSSGTYGSGWTFGDVTSGEDNRKCVLGTTLAVFVSGNQTPDMYCFVDDLPNTTSLRLFNINQDAYVDVVSVSDTVTSL